MEDYVASWFWQFIRQQVSNTPWVSRVVTLRNVLPNTNRNFLIVSLYLSMWILAFAIFRVTNSPVVLIRPVYLSEKVVYLREPVKASAELQRCNHDLLEVRPKVVSGLRFHIVTKTFCDHWLQLQIIRIQSSSSLGGHSNYVWWCL